MDGEVNLALREENIYNYIGVIVVWSLEHSPSLGGRLTCENAYRTNQQVVTESKTMG